MGKALDAGEGRSNEARRAALEAGFRGREAMPMPLLPTLTNWWRRDGAVREVFSFMV
jgi:hypothetical protein